MVLEISIVVPCYYPHIKYLDVTFNDICTQTLLPKEVILAISEVNDETKNTIHEKFIKSFNDCQIDFKIINTIEKQHAGINRNMGAKIAICEYIMFIDADDTVHPKKIEATKFFLEKYRPNILLHTLVVHQPMNFLKSYKIDYEKANVITNNEIFIDTFGKPPIRNRKREISHKKGGHSIGLKSSIKNKYCAVTHGYATVKKSIFDKFQYTDLRNGEDGVFIRDVLWNVGEVILVTIPLINYRPDRES